jgi:DNA-binding response OmpR family regulator
MASAKPRKDYMSKKTILIVDDNEDLTKGLRILLRSHDYATTVAGDAVSAISMAKSEKPDLIILDLGLPAGDGYLVMERLSNISTLSATPVIVVSARDPEGHRNRSLEGGAKAFLQKPVEKEVLLATIEKVLMGASGLQQV